MTMSRDHALLIGTLRDRSWRTVIGCSCGDRPPLDVDPENWFSYHLAAVIARRNLERLGIAP